MKFLVLLLSFFLGGTLFAQKQDCGWSIAEGQIINVRMDGLFDYDKSTIRPNRDRLDKVISFMKSNDSVTMEIGVHMDTRGSEVYSRRLDQSRAQAIAKYFVANGIEVRRLVAKGYGESKPLISDQEIAKLKSKEEKEKAHQTNRRIEFKIIKID